MPSAYQEEMAYIEPTPEFIDQFQDFLEKINQPENEYWLEMFYERSGNIEFCGGAISEEQADFMAFKEVKKKMRFQKEPPKPCQCPLCIKRGLK